MKKSLIALAVLGTSFAASAQVTLSGRAAMEVGNWQATGATSGVAADFKDRTRVVDVGSRLLLSVNENLGGGMRAFLACETGINIDNGSSTGQANTNNANTTTFCSREGHAGIGNNTAEVRLGRQNVWWTQGALNPLGARYHAGEVTTDLLTGGIGQYTVRGENMIMLVAGRAAGAFAGSNVYYGFMGASGHLNTLGGANPIGQGQENGEAAAAGRSSTGKYQGLKLQYSQGVLIGGLDHQSSNTGILTSASQASTFGVAAATSTVGTSNERSATRIGAGWRFAGAKSPNLVSLQYTMRERTLTTATNTATKGKENVLQLVGHYDLGSSWLLNLSYGVASDRSDNNVKVANTGAKGLGLGVVKVLSPRTHAYFQYRTIDNASAASYGLNGGNYSSGSAATGADSKAFGFGLVSLF